MKRAEFIKLWVDTVREGRRRNFPGIRPSEEAVSAMHDERKAASMWSKHRKAFAPLTVEQARAVLADAKPPAEESC